jgi:hypothetical protein
MIARVSWVVRCKERAIALGEGNHLIGRAKDCTVAIDDDGLVSRHHAELIVTPEGVTLRDLGSRNGVYLKYRRLTPREDVRVFHGDTFLIGQTNLVLMQQRGRERKQTFSAGLLDETTDTGEMPAVTGLGMPYKRFLAEADRSFASGDFDRFAGATHLLLATLTAAIHEGMAADEPAFQSAQKHAVALAEMRGVEWIDELCALLEAGPLVPSIETITTLQRLFDERGWQSERLDAYVEKVRPVLEDAGPRGRALLLHLTNLTKRRTTPP